MGRSPLSAGRLGDGLTAIQNGRVGQRVVRELGSWPDFLREAGSMPHQWIVRSYQTVDECSQWFAGQRVLFDEIAEWLAESDLLVGDVVMIRDEFIAEFGIAFAQDPDAVAFALSWGEFLDRRPATAC